MEEKRTRTSFLSTLVLMATLLSLGPAQSAFGWKEQMHQSQLTLDALKLVKKFAERKYSPEIWTSFASYILRGSYDEDFPCSGDIVPDRSARFLNGLVRANNHYRHAISGRGLSDSPWVGLGDPDVDTLTWAKNNSSLNRAEEFGNDLWAYKNWGWTDGDVDYGNMSWAQAIDRYGYTDESKALAFYTLGFLCHLLQDMGCPEHVHDDPHGASGFTGFEMWVYDKWDLLEPNLESLAIKTFPRIEEQKRLDAYFTNLCLIGYSIDRFYGGELSIAKGKVDPASDLGRMFDISYDPIEAQWLLENKDKAQPVLIRTPNLESVVEQGSSNLFNWDFEWSPKRYAKNPLGTKGHDQGEFWPTSVEIPGSEFGNDVEGYYYIELSGEFPGALSGEEADPIRHLYPKAFLPTPLPEVAGELPRWQEMDANGRHLYTLIGEKIFGPVVAYTAGLINHYYDIVNHPPYVKEVEAIQEENRYHAQWTENKGKRSLGRSILDVISRDLETQAATVVFGPGRITCRVTFSEAVQDVVVKLGNTVLPGELNPEGAIWTGQATIEESGPENEMTPLSVTALDLNNHYGGEGAALDGDPRTPARRIMPSEDNYEWIGYQEGEDTNYEFQIRRAREGESSAAENCPPISGTWKRTGGGIWIISQSETTVHWVGKSAEEPFPPPDGRWFFYQEFKGEMIDDCHFQGTWNDIPEKSYMKNKGTIVLKIVSPNLIQSVPEYKGYKTDPPGLLELKR